MNKSKTEIFNHKRKFDWQIISQSYFQCALISARILKKKLIPFLIAEGSPNEWCLKEIYGEYPQPPKYLIFPILFNFKHGIEIYLKCIIGIKDSKFSRDHDLLFFLEEAKITDEKVKNIIKKYALSKFLLPNNKKNDINNEFERYPQGTPYDIIKSFSTELKSLELDELIEDIEFIYKSLRKISLSIKFPK